MTKRSVHVVWFKRDLRVVDHRVLQNAARSGGAVIPLYVVEPDLWRQSDRSARQWEFTRECLLALQQDLAAIGQSLIVRVGDVRDVLESLCAEYAIERVWSHEETGCAWTYGRDQRVGAWLQARGIDWSELPQHGVVRRLKTRDGWARRWDRWMSEPLTAPPSQLPHLEGLQAGSIPVASDLELDPDVCPDRQQGGREAGLERLHSFLSVRGRSYRKDMSSPVSGFEGCSRLSPHLALGTISMREAAQATWHRQRQLKEAATQGPVARDGWRGSMKSFSGRLHWHCHFMQKLEDEPSLEHANLHRAYDGLRPTAADGESERARLHAWCSGETGLPFTDAVMRALHATGWMNFRMRAMLMAVASYHLWLDWRLPGEHLARMFTDYEPGIHWPQVQMQSGTTGINTIRIYNPIKQGFDQDPTGAFIRRWVPELAPVPSDYLHEPWKWENAGTVMDRIYPLPIMDALAAAKEARRKVWSLRGGKAFKETASEIQSKHGSRKSGVPMRGGRKQKKKTHANGDQLSLFP